MADDTVDLGIDDLTDAVEVGAGGFGTVYRARQASLRRDVAVKVVANTVKDEKVRIRFEREIQAMGMLSGHPNIVTVYDSGFTGSGQPYILMDFMEKGSLGNRLDEAGPMPFVDVVATMVKVCGALETAHQAGILHRDLKPENILVSGYDEPKLGDFGIARLKGGPETGTSSLTASIEHVAPELLEAKQPAAASDLYALGSTMYKLLTGTAAFIRPTDESIVPALTRIRDEPVPDLRQRGIPGPVAEVVERAMAKDPDTRYVSAKEMGAALRHVQRTLGLGMTAMPIREEEAAAARESTRTINSDDLARSMEDIRSSGPTGIPSGPQPSYPSAPTVPGQGGGYGSGPTPAYPPVPSPGYGSGGAPTAPPPFPQQPYQPQGLGGAGFSGAGSSGPGYDGSGGYPQQAPPSSGGTPWVKVAAGIGALAVVVVIGLVVALNGGDEAPEVVDTEPVVTAPEERDTPSEPTEPDATEPEAYVAFERLVDDAEAITVDAPRMWSDVSGGPWIIDEEEVGQQIEAAPDLEAFRTTWTTPGVIFGMSEQLRESFTPEELLDALDFGTQCTLDGREPYSDPAYEGFRDDYSDCGGTDTSYTIIAAQPVSEERVVLVQFQAVDDRDDAALARVIETFFAVADNSGAPGETPTPTPTPSQ